MKHLPGFLLLVATGISSLSAQSPADAITRVLEDQVDAWNKGDIEAYMKGYWNSDSTSFVSGGSVMKGYEAVLARYRKTYGTRETMGTLSFDELKIRILSASAAVVTGAWKLIRVNDQPRGRFTLIVEKKSEGWRIVYDHTSSGP